MFASLISTTSVIELTFTGVPINQGDLNINCSYCYWYLGIMFASLISTTSVIELTFTGVPINQGDLNINCSY